MATQRRQLLAAAGAGWLAVHCRVAQSASAPLALEAHIRQWADGQPIASGRVRLEIAPLVENGNAVPVAVSVDSPMTDVDHVQEIVLFNERNPQREVARFALTPAQPRAQVATRIRLAQSQRVVALARLSDGSRWQAQAEVIVTLAACVEG